MSPRPATAPTRWRDDPARVRPMLATLSDSPPDSDLQNPALIYEPKYDGIRALIALEPDTPSPQVRIWSRLGNEKTAQFPEVVRGLKDFGRRLRGPVLLDGEIVALDAHGEPAGFQKLQGRMHLTSAPDIARQSAARGAAFIAFDILRDGADDLRGLPLTDRRARLERLFGASGSSEVRFGEYEAGDGRRLYRQAVSRGLEGLVVKTADSIYETDRRSRAWRKVKLVRMEEFVVGGWTDPRLTRSHLGALLLGMFDGNDGKLRYVGHSGTGFSEKELARLHGILKARAIETSPFRSRPPSNERPHWTRPDLVVQVRFSEWTDEGYLRHPVYLGLRDDVDPKKVRWHDPVPGGSASAGAADAAGAVGRADGTGDADEEDRAVKKSGAAKKAVKKAAKKTTKKSGAAAGGKTAGDETAGGETDGAETAGAETAGEAGVKKKNAAGARASGSRRTKADAASAEVVAAAPSARGQQRAKAAALAAAPKVGATLRAALDRLVDTLHALESAKKDGTLDLPDGSRLDVTNLAKLFWPAEKLTKGDVLRYYVQVSPWLLPVVEDRPLVMKRFPNGVTGKAFYQQRAPDDVPDGVRVDQVADDGEESGLMPRLVGGSLQTLLYMTQLAAISQDPWFSRVQSPGDADYVALDLDPMPGVPFTQVLEVARHVHTELESLGVPSYPKTSGASGLHVYIALPEETSYETGQLLCNIVATVVAMKHRRIATVERQVAKRGRTVYVDYLQNIEGKTLATAYSARASAFAGVSMPLSWDEVYDSIEPPDFTIRNAIARLMKIGDPWAGLRNQKPVDMRAVIAKLAKKHD